MNVGNDQLLRIQVRAYRSEDPRLFAVLSNLSPAMRRRRVLQLLRNALLAEEGLPIERIPTSEGALQTLPETPSVPSPSDQIAITADANVHHQADFGPAVSLTGMFSPPAAMRSLNDRA